MATLVHEVWVSLDENGQELHACITAGSRGNGARELLKEENAKLLYCFEAETHFDALTKYHLRTHNEVYSNPQPDPWDFQPYPQEWADQQLADGVKPLN